MLIPLYYPFLHKFYFVAGDSHIEHVVPVPMTYYGYLVVIYLLLLLGGDTITPTFAWVKCVLVSQLGMCSSTRPW